MMSYNFLERELEAVEDKMNRLDGECDELTDDLQRAVELLRRCTYHLRPDRLDPIAEDVKKFLDAYDDAYQPEPKKVIRTEFDYIMAEYR